MKCKNRNGEEVAAYDVQGGAIKFLYGTAVGRMFLKLLISPGVSRLAGRFLNSRFSKIFIKPFVKNNKIVLSDYVKESFDSYNDFFCREIKSEKRPFESDEGILPSPCDGKLTVCKVDEEAHFQIKGGDYTAVSLLKNEAMAEKYFGGTLLLIRLSVDDYHRYCYVANGEKGENFRIPGKYHTVNPAAAEKCRIYKENTREYSVLSTELFGDILMMEVGAMMVGRIVNRHGAVYVHRGEEKGHFEFGGSTVILMFEKDKLSVDGDILKNTADGYETVVKMGERIGVSLCTDEKRDVAWDSVPNSA